MHVAGSAFDSAVTQPVPDRGVAPPHAERPFTVQDDIAFSYFGDLFSGGLLASSVFSPDGRFFVIETERGRLDLGKPESTLRVFRTGDVQAFVAKSENVAEPLPIWSFAESGHKDGPIVTNIRWLADSSGIAFLAKIESGNNQLMVARLNEKTIRPLTPETQDVTAFDIRDPKHVVYTVLSPAIQERMNLETHATSIVGTGRDLYSLIFSGDIHSEMEEFDRSELWAVLDGRRFRIEDKLSKHPLTIYSTGQQALALSPDGRSVVTALPVATIPAGWETLYPPQYPFLRDRINPHKQEIEAFSGIEYINEYVLVDLPSQNIKRLTNAPIGSDIGWTNAGIVHAAWSADQRSVVLSNTFVPPQLSSGDQHGNRPCVAVFDLRADALICLQSFNEATKSGPKQKSRKITNIQFSPNDGSRRVILHYFTLPDGSPGETSYVRASDNTWKEEFTENKLGGRSSLISLSIKQGLNDPPVLVATDSVTQTSRVILDPNPQLKDICLGEASVYKWKDKTGLDHVGGLYKPTHYVPGGRYPLVIQTHGFLESQFIPSGFYPSAFAARELAGAGIMVLQVADIRDCGTRLGTPEEASCAVANYEAAVEQLVRDGLVNIELIGIIGFSRTSYYIMQTLTTSSLHFKAASITDGFNGGYFQYLTAVDLNQNSNIHETDAVIGSRPFGDGLRQWLDRSPEFNITKVTSALQVVALNRATVLLVWEPYAELRALNKPVDLLVLPEGTHVLSNPAGRMASQGATVDWFRFWLQGYEDPAAGKQVQYIRWRKLRTLQEQNQTGSKSDDASAVQ